MSCSLLGLVLSGLALSCAAHRTGELPTARAPLTREQRVVELAVSGTRACARTTPGAVACWGATVEMQPTAGCGPLDRCQFSPAVTGRTSPRWVEGVTEARSLALGGFGAAILGSGEVVAWSLEGEAALEALPVTGLTGASQLALGLRSGCAARREGEVWCWGGGAEAEIEADSWSAARRLEGLTGVVHLAANFDRACAVTQGGEVACWGGQSEGLIASEITRWPGLEGALEVGLAEGATCARSRTGALRCWGAGVEAAAGALGELHDVVGLSLGRHRGCALRRGGRLACWDAQGPEQAPVVADEITQVALGWDQRCLLRQDGSVRCDSGSSPQGAPAEETGLDDANQVAIDQIGCALRQGGRVSCWGPGFGPAALEITLPQPP